MNYHLAGEFTSGSGITFLNVFQLIASFQNNVEIITIYW